MNNGVGADAVARRAWPEAHASLQAAALVSELSAGDLERLGMVAQLLGRDDEGDQAWEQAHHAFLAIDDPASAARCGFWLAMRYMDRGQMAHAGGWLARAQRILDAAQLDCAEQGYVRIPQALQLLDSGDVAGAIELFEEIQALGLRFGDKDLITMGCLGYGTALIRRGDIPDGTARLDEAMISVLSNEVSPLVAGTVYCVVVEVCQAIFDLQRAHEWTAALTQWCNDQPGIVPFRARCQVYRAELMQLHGDWQGALEVALDAERRLSGPPAHPAVSEAYYQQGELHRLRGSVADADEAFKQAEEKGRRPEPGRALLRLAQGRPDAAAIAIKHALNETADDVTRARLLVAAVEIFAAVNDSSACRNALNQLTLFASSFDSHWLNASVAQATGMMSLAEGDPNAGASSLRSALADWQRLDAPYQAARTRVLLARTATLLGDSETAAAQLEMARRAFIDLGAVAEASRVVGTIDPQGKDVHGLTVREVEVLRLLARGLTNRAIATNLTISEKTVANHVGNILGKLGVSSRSAATAFAYESGLV
jgi:DNA-binding CsgD family transcriptional regulator